MGDWEKMAGDQHKGNHFKPQSILFTFSHEREIFASFFFYVGFQNIWKSKIGRTIFLIKVLIIPLKTKYYYFKVNYNF